MYSLRRAVYGLHCALTVCIVHCAVRIVFVHCALHIVNCALAHYALRITHCALHIAHCAVLIVNCALVHCAELMFPYEQTLCNLISPPNSATLSRIQQKWEFGEHTVCSVSKSQCERQSLSILTFLLCAVCGRFV